MNNLAPPRTNKEMTKDLLIFFALMSGRAKAEYLKKNGTKEQKKLARIYIKAEEKMIKFYNSPNA